VNPFNKWERGLNVYSIQILLYEKLYYVRDTLAPNFCKVASLALSARLRAFWNQFISFIIIPKVLKHADYAKKYILFYLNIFSSFEYYHLSAFIEIMYILFSVFLFFSPISNARQTL
jgi:hypothetical protein